MPSTVTFNVKLDRTRFPMIWIESLSAYVSWLPATKIQFEYFLTETTLHGFTAKTYDDILKTSPRVSPGKITANNYWRALLTGVLPPEAQAFVNWLGDDRGEMFDLPTGPEWYAAYEECLNTPVPSLTKLWDAGMTDRALNVVKNIYSALKPDQKQTLADIMLMKRGVHEWVRMSPDSQGWGIAGFPRSGLGFGITSPHVRTATPISDQSSRHDSCGFRFLKRST